MLASNRPGVQDSLQRVLVKCPRKKQSMSLVITVQELGRPPAQSATGHPTSSLLTAGFPARLIPASLARPSVIVIVTAQTTPHAFRPAGRRQGKTLRCKFMPPADRTDSSCSPATLKQKMDDESRLGPRGVDRVGAAPCPSLTSVWGFYARRHHRIDRGRHPRLGSWGTPRGSLRWTLFFRGWACR